MQNIYYLVLFETLRLKVDFTVHSFFDFRFCHGRHSLLKLARSVVASCNLRCRLYVRNLTKN